MKTIFPKEGGSNLFEQVVSLGGKEFAYASIVLISYDNKYDVVKIDLRDGEDNEEMKAFASILKTYKTLRSEEMFLYEHGGVVYYMRYLCVVYSNGNWAKNEYLDDFSNEECITYYCAPTRDEVFKTRR